MLTCVYYLSKTTRVNMARQNVLDINIIDRMWGYYQKRQKAQWVVDQCRKAGLRVHYNTVRKYINNGDPERDIIPFKQRLMEIRASTAQVVDQKIVSAAIADIDGWRRLVDQGQVVVAMLLDRAHERLKPQTRMVRDRETGERKEEVVPLEAKDLRAAAEAVKVAFSSMKQAAETHDIWNLQSGSEVDGWDMMMKEHLEAFTEEERVALRDRGVWPDRIPLPPFLGGGEGEEETDGDES